MLCQQEQHVMRQHAALMQTVGGLRTLLELSGGAQKLGHAPAGQLAGLPPALASILLVKA